MSRFYLKIIIPSVLSVLLFILTIFLVIIPHFKNNIMNGKREMIKELTNSAWSILAKYENDERNGILTREEAQKTAVSRIEYLRYGEENKDYFWITDMYPKMIVHPYRPDLNGKDLTSFTDPHGKRMFVEFVETVRQSDYGYVDYMWQWKDDSLHIVPKLSYVKIFEPWNWVLGTGVYIEDVKKEIKALTKKLLWISTGISALIALLLLFISQQSIKTERKRIEAENELNESKEKYKTLVEAATEGLIMLIDGRISFSNSVISKMTDFGYSELTNLELKELISENNNNDLISTFSQEVVKGGQYEINLKKKNGGFIEALVTSSTTMLYNKPVNIIIVKDITVDRDINFSSLDYEKLIGLLNIGFFRTRIDAKGKFLFANETAVRIFGYENFRELSENNILKLVTNTDDRKYLRNWLIDQGCIKNKVIKVTKKNNETITVAVTLIAFKGEGTDDFICDGLIEDITIQENEKEETMRLISELKSVSFLIEQRVSGYVSPFTSLDADSTIKEVLKTLAIKKTDNLLITKNGKDVIGIITDNDIKNRVISLNLKPDNPAYLIMSSPVIYFNGSSPVMDAISVCDDRGIGHLVIKNEAEEITGILNLNDINKAVRNSFSFLKSNVKKAETIEYLKQNYKMLGLFVKPLIRSEISAKYITGITSSFSDSVIQRLIELVINEIGEPPLSFSFICMGSEGRKEETLYTDQDNAIVYEDVPADKANSVNKYFNLLGEKVCNALDYIGYSFCKGNIMAKNNQWCQPVSVWEKYFENWISTPEPQNLLDATIFFDFRNTYGDEEITTRLRKTINNSIGKNQLFIYHLAFNLFNTKLPQIIADKTAETVDLKSAVNMIVMYARTYALQNNISNSNTIERLYALKAKKVINTDAVDEMVYVYNFLMKLRFRNQVELADNYLFVNNILKIKNLNEFELSSLKKALAMMPVYQNKVGLDFRIAT